MYIGLLFIYFIYFKYLQVLLMQKDLN